MIFTNCLNITLKQKKYCKIDFLKLIGIGGCVGNHNNHPEDYVYVDIIAHILGSNYIFECYQDLEDKHTSKATQYLGHWNGIE